MVFSSIPVYLDQPNWQQHSNQQQVGGTTEQNPHRYTSPPIPPAQPAVPPPQMSGAGLSTSQVRPNSMVERARLAKIPLPEAALQCPRCESTNTKFCYFNNYSLSQPRHFCKTCRRYWTCGGALRNVPVGGGCRRNKRSKSNGGTSMRSKSTVVVAAEQASTSSTPAPGASQQSYTNPNKIPNLGQITGFTSNLQILPQLQGLEDFNSSHIGLDFGGIQVNNTSGSTSTVGGLVDQWRSSLQQMQQFPFLINTTGLEQSSSVLYPILEGNERVNHYQAVDYTTQLRSKQLMDNVKTEENEKGVGNNLSRNLLGNFNMNSGNDQYSWGGSSSSWSTDLPGFSSNNSASHIL